MSRPSLGTERVPVPFSAVPATQSWTALCLGLGGLSLAMGLGLAISERVRALHAPLVESVLEPRVLSVAPTEPANGALAR